MARATTWPFVLDPGMSRLVDATAMSPAHWPVSHRNCTTYRQTFVSSRIPSLRSSRVYIYTLNQVRPSDVVRLDRDFSMQRERSRRSLIAVGFPNDDTTRRSMKLRDRRARLCGSRSESRSPLRPDGCLPSHEFIGDTRRADESTRRS